MISERVFYQLDPTVKPFVPKGLKIYTQDSTNQKEAQPQKIKELTNKWIEACAKNKLKKTIAPVKRPTKNNNNQNQYSLFENDSNSKEEESM